MTDPTSRALELLGLLESRPVWAGDELAQRLGVTARTVRRDVDRLRSLGYTVEADPGVGGGYALGRGQVLPPLLLDDEEAAALTLALTAAAASGTVPDPSAALRALGKVDAVMPSALRHRVQGLRAAIELDPARSGIDGAVLLTCADAVRRRLRLRFVYRDRHGGTTDRDVEPHRLSTRGRTWYVTAYDVGRADWRSFRLDRMTGARLSTFPFRPREGLEGALARLHAAPPPSAYRHEVTVLVHAPYDVVATPSILSGATLDAVDAGTTRFRTGADDPAVAARWLASLGFAFTVIGDEAVRQAVAELARRLDAAAAH